MTEEPAPTGFPGFRQKYTKNFFTYPIILEEYWPELSGTEQKVLDFILRRTLGFQKTSDKISLSQFSVGAGTKNKGAGVSRSQAKRSLESLEKMGFIRLEKRSHATTTIYLKLEKEKETSILEVTANAEIVRLINLFAPVALHRTEEYLRDRKQIATMEKLVGHYGAGVIENAIKALPSIHGKPYMPTITSPVELDKKFSKLLSALKRKKDTEDNEFRHVM